MTESKHNFILPSNMQIKCTPLAPKPTVIVVLEKYYLSLNLIFIICKIVIRVAPP